MLMTSRPAPPQAGGWRFAGSIGHVVPPVCPDPILAERMSLLFANHNTHQPKPDSATWD